MTATSLDLAIIRCLQRDPRVTNKSIALAVGITEQTVKVRIRNLVDDKVMRVMAQRDLAAAGYPIIAFATLTAEASAIRLVAERTTVLEQVLSVVLSVGTPEIIVTLVARDFDDLDGLCRVIGAIRGVARVEMATTSKVHLFRTGAGDLTAHAGPPLPGGDTDPVDAAIVQFLVEDGRSSNREIARRLDISEGAVRARLKRLTERRAMTLGVVCEPDKVGYGYAAYIFLDGEPEVLNELLQEVSTLEMVGFAATTTGAHDAVLFCVAADERPMTTLCLERLRSDPGITRVIYRPLVGTLKHRYDYVLVAGPSRVATADYLTRASTTDV